MVPFIGNTLPELERIKKRLEDYFRLLHYAGRQKGGTVT
jgi:hypothetical protein